MRDRDARGFPGCWARRLSSPGFVCLLLAVGTLLTFCTVARNDFVNYDDPDYVTANSHVQGGLNWENVRWAFTSGHASNWHPLTWLSHMIDCQVFGQWAWAHHLVNVGFHIASTILLFLTLRKMSGALWRSAFVAALFALHPLHVESVAWISERKDVLSTFFLWLTLAAYVCYVEQSTVQGPRSAGGGTKGRSLKSQVPGPKLQVPNPKSQLADPGPQGPDPETQGSHFTFYVLCSTFHVSPSGVRSYLLALACFALGLMSKPMLVTVPFLLLLLDYWPLERFPRNLQDSEHRISLALVAEKLPFLALCLASSVVTFLVQRKGGAVSTSLSLAARIGNAVVSYARYMGKMCWPQNLSVLYPHPGHWPIWQVVASSILVVGISGAVVWMSKNRPYLAVGWLWFLGALLPVIGLVQVGIQSMADRYTYIPLIGLFIALVW